MVSDTLRGFRRSASARRPRCRAPLAFAFLCTLAAVAAAEENGHAGAVLTKAGELQRRGGFAEAVVAAREAAQLFAAQGRAAEHRAALAVLAEAQVALGLHAEAVQTCSEALAQAVGSDRAAQASIRSARASAWLALGEVARADADLHSGLALARESDAHAVVAAILLNRGNLHAAEGRTRDALAAYDEAAALAERSQGGETAARALANAAGVALASGGAPSGIRSRLVRADALARGVAGSHDKAILLVNLAVSFRRLSEQARDPDDLRRAYADLRLAERAASALDDSLAASWALGYLGELYAKEGRNDEALILSRRAIFAAQLAAAPEALYRWQWQTGRILRETGRTQDAILAYRAAVESLQPLRSGIPAGRRDGSFRESVGRVYLELVDLLLETAPKPSASAAHRARLLEVREIVEQLKVAELRDYFRDDCVDALAAKVERLDEVSLGAAVVYPIVLPDRLEILLSLPSGIRRIRVPVPAEALTAEARKLRQLLEKRTTREFLPPARQLYTWLIRPLEGALAEPGIDTLVFVPDGALRTIPMAALHDGSRFVIDRWAVATTPGLRLTDPRPLDRENPKTLLIGLSEGVQGFAPLSHAGDELRAVHEILGGRLLLDEDFQLDRIERTLHGDVFDVVHIASHGHFADDEGDSFLLTWDGRITIERLAELIGVVRFRDTPIELLTLSACETAQGDDRAALGLAGVAIRAGARSALGTLWSVDDASTTALMAEFYRQLRDPSVSKALALQRAQRALAADPDFDHPFYWAPFLLISNWL